MRKLVMGFAVAGLIALSPKSEARFPSFSEPLPHFVPPGKALPQVGVASWYGAECAGNNTASGEAFDLKALTAAHRDLPFGTIVQITNLTNHRSVRVRVNDRGPAIEGRLIDLSWGAARRLGFVSSGLTSVRVEVVEFPRAHAPLQHTNLN